MIPKPYPDYSHQQYTHTTLNELFHKKNNAKSSCSSFPISPNKNTCRQRKSFETNETPSMIPENLSENDELVSDKDIQEHAYMRVQLFALSIIAVFGLAKRSGDKQDRNLSILIGPAYRQAGMGVTPFPACHMHLAAGYIDNLRDHIMNELKLEVEVSPKKKVLLENKGFSQEDWDYLQKHNFDTVAVSTLFRMRWPKIQNSNSSVLYRTKVCWTLNSTTKLPRIINLVCDKGLESLIRNELPELYSSAMQMKESKESLIERFTTLVRDYFQNAISIVAKRESIAVKYQESLLEVQKIIINEEENEELLRLHLSTLLDCFEKLIPETKKCKTNENFHVPHIKIPLQFDFINNLRKVLDKKSGGLRADLMSVFNTDFEAAREEISSQIHFLDLCSRLCRLERDGTQMPEMKFLFGQYEEDTKTWHLGEEAYKRAQSRMLQPEMDNIFSIDYQTLYLKGDEEEKRKKRRRIVGVN